jgi:hypothetical protein
MPAREEAGTEEAQGKGHEADAEARHGHSAVLMCLAMARSGLFH